jgi:hypothetical protein
MFIKETQFLEEFGVVLCVHRNKNEPQEDISGDLYIGTIYCGATVMSRVGHKRRKIRVDRYHAYYSALQC